ncbi:hypothetical protein HanXRQr2_Chr05g0223371 [Helianthus annuus]|uniref:Uncharacterized protein n=1 Tax=Helianthus annuus TaxID=4232 RepID=A0A9K3J2L5_HELAN|nr:hypothetical protein HanXRQr2_Chr05g0223371 [Helianthus annuus]KAJ0923422.1 hypothetical protein HanPSC8_Chr05g0215701 [Helianthus annuus]
MWRRITLLIKLLNHQRKSQVAEPSPVLGVLYITFKYLAGRVGCVVCTREKLIMNCEFLLFRLYYSKSL